MQCKYCNRELKEDSRFCDYCGNPVIIENQEKAKFELDKSALIKGIAISVGVTVLITAAISGIGLPVLFGGLFLPFFWKAKKDKNLN